MDLLPHNRIDLPKNDPVRPKIKQIIAGFRYYLFDLQLLRLADIFCPFKKTKYNYWKTQGYRKILLLRIFRLHT
jgi:hypothetical protein